MRIATTISNERIQSAAANVAAALNKTFVATLVPLAHKHGLDGGEALTAITIGLIDSMTPAIAATAGVPAAEVEGLRDELFALIGNWLIAHQE